MLIGRQKELELIRSLVESKNASLIVIKGRRRIGKTKLAREAARGLRLLEIVGIAPDKTVTAKVQKIEFLKQFIEVTNAKIKTSELDKLTDWSDIFRFVSKNLKHEPQVIFLDEISWLASKDNTFIPKFKNWWDKDLSNRRDLTVIFSGSVSTWINKNIINNTALFGRLNLILNLSELTITESAEMIRKLGCKFSDYETFAILSIMGGIPWYIEQLNKNQSALENINRMCFSPDGILLGEFERIFYDIFSKKSQIYFDIIELLANGERELVIIREDLQYSSGGALTKHLQNLCESGFVARHNNWDISTGKLSNRVVYRLKDNYIRFFIKVIRSEKSKFQLHEKNFSTPGFQSALGLGLENLIINNIELVHQKLNLKPEEILNQGPLSKRLEKKGARFQIDFIIQTRTKSVYICEIKFSSSRIGSEIVDEVEEKAKKLKVPHGFAIIPVLITNAEVTSGVVNSNYFGKLVHIGELL